MRYTEIDGKRYEVKDCGHCPFGDMSDAGWAEYCTHPKSGQDKRTPLDIGSNGFAKSCPLREVQEHKPCPFCGSTELEEIYVDDEGERLEEWMMEEANKDGGDYGSWQEYLDTLGYAFCVNCTDCHGSVISNDSMTDAWARWNRRTVVE